jgi:hypothetical protein
LLAVTIKTVQGPWICGVDCLLSYCGPAIIWLGSTLAESDTKCVEVTCVRELLRLLSCHCFIYCGKKIDSITREYPKNAMSCQSAYFQGICSAKRCAKYH